MTFDFASCCEWFGTGIALGWGFATLWSLFLDIVYRMRRVSAGVFDA